MRRLFLFAALLVVLAAGSVSALEQFVIYGYSYYTAPEVVGTQTTVLGKFDPEVGFTYPLPVDLATNEYTFAWTGTISSVTPGAFTTVYEYADAGFAIWQDPSKNAAYGASPPNATAPSTFEDGTMILSGTLSNVIRIDYNFGFPEPSVVADATFTGGTRLGELPTGGVWTFHSGLSSSPFLGIPSGYKRNWASKVVLQSTVPVEESTWGAIKGLYAE